LFGAGAAAPAVRLVMAPVFERTNTEGKWIRVAPLADLEDGEPKRAPVISEVTDAWTRYPKDRLGAVWLIKDRDEVHALSATCPHLGCNIAKVENGFLCPCHTSAFDSAGNRVSGPTPRGMDPIETRVSGNGPERSVEVRFVKFRQGVPGREVVE